MGATQGWQVRLFSLFGFEVKLDLSWLLLALLITWSLAAGLFPAEYPGLTVTTYAWMGVAVAVGVFFSIVLHEFAHSVVARQYGLPIRGITLFVFGGVAEMAHEPPSARAEFRMAIAGPLASFAIAWCFWVLGAATAGWPVPVVAIFETLALVNLTVAVFNLVPAFPLDGGRVLRAVLWHQKGDLRSATKTSASIGRGFGLALMALGVVGIIGGNLIGGMWWILIGLFIRGAAGASVRQQLVEELFADRPVTDFMIRDPITVPPDISVQAWLDDYVYRHHVKMYPVIDDGDLLGSISIGDIRDLPADDREITRVRDRMQPVSGSNAVTADTSADDLLEAMIGRRGATRCMVLDSGRLVGVIALKDLLDRLAIRLELEKGQ